MKQTKTISLLAWIDQFVCVVRVCSVMLHRGRYAISCLFFLHQTQVVQVWMLYLVYIIGSVLSMGESFPVTNATCSSLTVTRFCTRCCCQHNLSLSKQTPTNKLLQHSIILLIVYPVFYAQECIQIDKLLLFLPPIMVHTSVWFAD